MTVSGGTWALSEIRTGRGPSVRVVDIVIGVGWVIFWVGWFAASAGVKRGQRGRGNWARFAGVRVMLILVVVLLVRLRVLKGHGVGYVRDPVLWGVGLAIWILGLGLAVWARIYLGRNWGMPASCWRSSARRSPSASGG
jgi:hypothetical protein